ncbi:MAG: hypothetical protein OHK0053_37290 [Microscillaceae bacterium]
MALLLPHLLPGQNKPEWKKTPTGLEYQHIPLSGSKKNIQRGDYVTFHVLLKNYRDSVLMNSYERGPIPDLKVETPDNPADVSQIFPYLAEGDSVVVKVSVDSLAKYSRRAMPDFTPPGTSLVYYLKILKVKSALAFEEEKNAAEAAQKSEEKAQIDEYAQKKQWKPLVLPSGLQYVVLQPGTGPLPKAGEKVEVHYVGKLLNEKIFDTSREEVAKANGQHNPNRLYGPFSFTLGRGEVIAGWDEGLAQLPVGTKAVLLIPSALGYGARGAGRDIPPYSVLVFEVELVSVKPAQP